MGDVPAVLARWLHISSVAILVGGFLYAGLVMAASTGTLSQDAAESLSAKAAARFRPFVWMAMGALILSGVYNIISSPGHSSRYLVWLAIKLLLVLHVFAVAILVTRPANPRRARQMTGGFVSGLLIILLSAYLRRIF